MIDIFTQELMELQVYPKICGAQAILQKIALLIKASSKLLRGLIWIALIQSSEFASLIRRVHGGPCLWKIVFQKRRRESRDCLSAFLL
jgi:hypothetical protein